jgi:hypothetical protein
MVFLQILGTVVYMKVDNKLLKDCCFGQCFKIYEKSLGNKVVKVSEE